MGLWPAERGLTPTQPGAPGATTWAAGERRGKGGECPITRGGMIHVGNPFPHSRNPRTNHSVRAMNDKRRERTQTQARPVMPSLAERLETHKRAKRGRVIDQAHAACKGLYRCCNSRWAGGNNTLNVRIGDAPHCSAESFKEWSSNGKGNNILDSSRHFP